MLRTWRLLRLPRGKKRCLSYGNLSCGGLSHRRLLHRKWPIRELEDQGGANCRGDDGRRIIGMDSEVLEPRTDGGIEDLYLPLPTGSLST